MGAIGDAIAAYAQPLIDETDGSPEQVETALLIGQMCWNLALLPEEHREESLAQMQPALKLDDAGLADFRRLVVEPMIRRYHAMFPETGRGGFQATTSPAGEKKHSRTGRNEPCPCGSGKKYKRCCAK